MSAKALLRDPYNPSLCVGAKVLANGKGSGTVVEIQRASVRILFRRRCHCCGNEADFYEWAGKYDLAVVG